MFFKTNCVIFGFKFLDANKYCFLIIFNVYSFMEVKQDLSGIFRKLKLLFEIDIEAKNYTNKKYLLMINYFSEIEVYCRN